MMNEGNDLNRVLQLEGNIHLTPRRQVKFAQQTAGTLVLPSGAIVACDPTTGGLPFTRQVQPGRYPVVLTLTTERNDIRVALARLVLADEPPKRWELATWPEQKRGWFNRRQPTSYSVDSAMGCFMDAQSENILRHYSGLKRPEFLSSALQLDESMGETCNWGEAVLDARTGANVMVFSAGRGDGYYSSYWGFSAQNTLVALVTDFGMYDFERHDDKF
ncbi:MAG: DUF4241 domain-containing protein [Anaerolineae bacterium]